MKVGLQIHLSLFSRSSPTARANAAPDGAFMHLSHPGAQACAESHFSQLSGIFEKPSKRNSKGFTLALLTRLTFQIIEL